MKNIQRKPKIDYLLNLRSGMGKVESMNAIGRHYNNLPHWRKRDEWFKAMEQEVLDQQDEQLVDEVERALYIKAKEGDAWAVKYVLNNRAPNRWKDAPTGTTNDDVIDKLDSYIKNNESNAD